MASSSEALTVTARTPGHSRSTRRLRREGLVPGVIYGGNGEPQPFSVEARALRNALAASGAVLEVALEGEKTNAVVKDVQRHPVRGEFMHIDLLRVRMDVAIQATVTLELHGSEESPGVKEGGVLNQEHREITIEALPGDIPDLLHFDVSGAEMNATYHVSDLSAPQGVTIVDDPETVIATVTPPTVETADDELETETGIVGEDGEVAEGQAEGDTAEEAEQSAADSGDSES